MIDGVTLRGRFAGSSSETFAGVLLEAASSRAIAPLTRVAPLPPSPRSPQCEMCDSFEGLSKSCRVFRRRFQRTSRCVDRCLPVTIIMISVETCFYFPSAFKKTFSSGFD